MVSVGTGASVGVWHPASTPVDTSGPDMAGFVPHAVSSLVNGGYGSPAFGSVVPSTSGGAMGRLKTRDWKTRDQFTRVENVGLENMGP